MLKKMLLAVMTLLVLTACGNKDEDVSTEDKEVIEDGAIGFNMNGDKIEAAENVPAKDEKAIKSAFEEYINALNAEEIDRYMNTIAENPKGFKYDEEKVYATNAFNQYDIQREVENVTIAEYGEKEAQVFANMKMKSLEIDTKVESENAGRQVTVFVKEDDAWKVTSVFYIGDNFQSNTTEQDKK